MSPLNYIQVQYRQDFIMEANAINPDITIFDSCQVESVPSSKEKVSCSRTQHSAFSKT